MEISVLLIRLIRTLFSLYTVALVGRALLPLLGLGYAHPLMRFLYRITEPLLLPVRRLLPVSGPVDLSPVVLVLALWLLEQVLVMVLLWL